MGSWELGKDDKVEKQPNNEENHRVKN
jgi:hypothetical protein